VKRTDVNARPQIVLGIETSCDETAAAIVARYGDGHGEILSEQVYSQVKDHAPYGGVVPEIAARAHVAIIDRIIGKVVQKSGVLLSEIDGVAATGGPGLIGGVLVGLTTAKAIAYALSCPLLVINHLEGHALTARLTNDVNFPYFLLLVSGGHTQILQVNGIGKYVRLGTTLDDALGEAFDKTAKLLGLGYPGGPEVERWARSGDPEKFHFPRPFIGTDHAHFSFSGLKTALRRKALSLSPLSDQAVSDLCSSFQAAAFDVVCDRLDRAISGLAVQGINHTCNTLVVAGGVAANLEMARRLSDVKELCGIDIIIPPARLCTDNGVMIAWAGAERLALGLVDNLETPARARWPLDPQAPVASGAGVKA